MSYKNGLISGLIFTLLTGEPAISVAFSPSLTHTNTSTHCIPVVRELDMSFKNILLDRLVITLLTVKPAVGTAHVLVQVFWLRPQELDTNGWNMLPIYYRGINYAKYYGGCGVGWVEKWALGKKGSYCIKNRLKCLKIASFWLCQNHHIQFRWGKNMNIKVLLLLIMNCEWVENHEVLLFLNLQLV